jgi:hypothetical protein
LDSRGKWTKVSFSCDSKHCKHLMFSMLFLSIFGSYFFLVLCNLIYTTDCRCFYKGYDSCTGCNLDGYLIEGLSRPRLVYNHRSNYIVCIGRSAWWCMIPKCSLVQLQSIWLVTMWVGYNFCQSCFQRTSYILVFQH